MSLDKFFTRFWLIVTIICFILIGISLFVAYVFAPYLARKFIKFESHAKPVKEEN